MNRIRAHVDRMFENDRGWKARVREVYASLEELQRYDEMYGIVERAGFESAEELWEANPMIGGSVQPSDFGVRGESRRRVREGRGPEDNVFWSELRPEDIVIDTGSSWKTADGALIYWTGTDADAVRAHQFLAARAKKDAKRAGAAARPGSPKEPQVDDIPQPPGAGSPGPGETLP